MYMQQSKKRHEAGTQYKWTWAATRNQEGNWRRITALYVASLFLYFERPTTHFARYWSSWKASGEVHWVRLEELAGDPASPRRTLDALPSPRGPRTRICMDLDHGRLEGIPFAGNNALHHYAHDIRKHAKEWLLHYHLSAIMFLLFITSLWATIDLFQQLFGEEGTTRGRSNIRAKGMAQLKRSKKHRDDAIPIEIEVFPSAPCWYNLQKGISIICIPLNRLKTSKKELVAYSKSSNRLSEYIQRMPTKGNFQISCSYSSIFTHWWPPDIHGQRSVSPPYHLC